MGEDVGPGSIAEELVGSGVNAELGVGLSGEFGLSSPQAPNKKAEPTKADNRNFLQIIKAS